MYFRTRTPKGDGNLFSLNIVPHPFMMNFRTRTPKGDGNATSSGSSSRTDEAFQNTNPERGRKPWCSCPARAGERSQFQNTNPERGRKRTFDDLDLIIIVHISEHEPRKGTETVPANLATMAALAAFQNTNPERGRKQRFSVVRSFKMAQHFRTRTPKGDGNFFHILPLSFFCLQISEHEPRKGTETS